MRVVPRLRGGLVCESLRTLMSGSTSPVPVMLIIAVFSRHPETLQWTRERLEEKYGPRELSSEPWHFNQTTYYDKSMGTDLQKQLHAFENFIQPDELPRLKRECIALENERRDVGLHAEERPLNIDPGYLTLGKFLLASTKDHCHRVYMTDGIFAEVTLYYRQGAFQPWPWTYADYRLEVVHEFLLEARSRYYERLRLAGQLPSSEKR